MSEITRKATGGLASTATSTPKGVARPAVEVSLPPFLENVRVAFTSLFANKLRALLTTLGICIGIASVIVLVSAGEAVQNYIAQQFLSVGPDLIYILPSSSANLSQAFNSVSSNGQSAEFSPLTIKDAELLRDPLNVPGVKMVEPALQLVRTTEYGSSQVRSQLVGISATYLDMIRWKIGSGRGIDEQDMTSNARVAVLGETTVKRLFPEGVNPLGETIQIGGVPFRVIGVLEKYSGASFGEDNNDVICIPLTTAQTRLQTERNLSGELPVSVIVMQATSTGTIDSAVEATTRFLRNQHKIKPGKEDDFIVTTTKDLIKSFDAVIGVITIFLSVIGGISLLVGGIGVMNIMMVTVTERTREIGLRKAVGARYRDIMLQFLTEATVLCFVGGALGLYIALVLILGVRAAIPDLNPTVSLRSIVLAVGVTSFIGMFFGLYPASRAASMDPIAALRSE